MKKKRTTPRYVKVKGVVGILMYHAVDGKTVRYGWRGPMHNGKPFGCRFGYDSLAKAVRARDNAMTKYMEMLQQENPVEYNSRTWNLLANETIRRAAAGETFEIDVGTHAQIATQRNALLRFARECKRTIRVHLWRSHFLLEVLA